MAASQEMVVQVHQRTMHLCLNFLTKLDFPLSLHVQKGSAFYQMLLAARHVFMCHEADRMKLLICVFRSELRGIFEVHTGLYPAATQHIQS